MSDQKTEAKAEPKLGREAQDKINAAKKAKAEAMKGALAVIKELVDKQQDPKFKAALTVIKPSLYGVTGTRTSGPSLQSTFLDMFKDKKEVHEDVIFKAMKIGRKECASIIKGHLKKSAPADRVWISFEANTGTYKVFGNGEKTPQGWDGFIPLDEKINLK